MTYSYDKTAGYDTPPQRIAAAISVLEYLPNGVAAWVEAHGGNKQLAAKNGDRIKKIVETLGDILVSMPASVEYQVFGLDRIPGGLNEPRILVFKSRDELIQGMKKRGINYTGNSPMGGSRIELQGQPQFDKLVGPMHGGGGKVRYETAPLNDRLSR